MIVPLNKPFIIGKELYYLAQSVLSGHIAGDGVFTKKCHALLEERFGAKKALLTTSCTSALEMAAILCNLRDGDEIILPSFTFVSTANAFYLRGAKLTFVDIRSDTLNLDETKLESLVTHTTRAIVPIHYAGIGCEMDSITQIADAHNLLVVEDAAQGINARYRNQYLGTIGDMGCFSFHETKNCICGEGGAIIINNERFIERAEIIREKGTNRAKFFRGQTDKYTWVDLGSSYLPSDLLAAFLYAQLENIDIITMRRKDAYNFYRQELSSLQEAGHLRLPVIPDQCESNSHIFYILADDGKTRDALLHHLNSKSIGAVFHYVPLHLSPIGRSMGYTEGQLPVTESVSERLLRLPLFHDIQREEQAFVVDSIKEFYQG